MLTTVLGKSGSGKTEWLYDLVIKKQQVNPSESIILIVPEQYTLETQYELIERHPNHCIMSIEVLSFARLAYRFSDVFEKQSGAELDEVTRHMILSKILETSADELVWIGKYKSKIGYIKELKGLMTEFHQYQLDDLKFEALSKITESKLLKQKLKDLSIIYRYYRQMIDASYISSESVFEKLIGGISRIKDIEDKTFVIDGFYGFTPIQYALITQLLKHSKQVYMTCTMDIKHSSSSLYYESHTMIKQLKHLCEKHKIKVDNPIILEDEHIYKSRYIDLPELKHLRDNLYLYPYKTYNQKNAYIHLLEATTLKEEVTYVADSIIKQIRDKSYQYRDIVVMTGELNQYKYIIEEVFNQYDIPYYIDEKMSLNKHPFIEMLLSGLQIFLYNFKYEDVFRYIKAGYVDVEEENLYLLENYVIAFGIRGSHPWHKSFVKILPGLKGQEDSFVEDIMNRINLAREQVIDSLKHLESIKEQSVVKNINHLYDWLLQIDAEKKLLTISESLQQKKEMYLSSVYQQVYSKLLNVFDQMIDINPSQVLDIEAFIHTLTIGFEVTDIGSVPPSMDQVVIGSIGRSRFREPKALYMIGFNDQNVPSNPEKASIITDYERHDLIASGIELAPDNKHYIYQEQFNIYMAMIRSKEHLFISYPVIGFDGKSIRPSILVHMLQKLFPKLKIRRLDQLKKDRIIINKEKPTFSRLIQKMHEQELTDQEIHQIQGLLGWYQDKDYYLNLSKNLNDYKIEKHLERQLSTPVIKAIYGDVLVNSVSRLETFVKCPYAHFVEYGLHLDERMEYKITMPDIGILFHSAIEKVAYKLNHIYHIEWEDLKEDQRKAIVLETVIEVVEAEQRGLFVHSARAKYLVNKLTRIVDRAIWAIRHQITSGHFRPMGHEFRFSGNDHPVESLKVDFGDDTSMILHGVVDRVDYLETEDAGYLTVIDYKSGDQHLDLVALYYGLQLQLFVYMNGMTSIKRLETQKLVKPAGMFYFHVDDPMILTDQHISYEAIERHVLTKMRLDGIVVNDADLIHAMDATGDKKSTVIPITLTKELKARKSAKVLEPEEVDLFLNYTNQKVREIGQEILLGQVTPKPYAYGESTGCDYCKYQGICGFDKHDGSYNAFEKLDKEALVEAIKMKQV